MLVTRPKHQAEALCRLLAEHGFEPLRFPTIAIEPIENPEPARASLQRLPEYDWVFFISANAVEYAFKLLDGAWPVCSAKVAAIGKKTALRLQNRGLVIDLVPEKRFTTENLIATLDAAAVKGTRCLIVKGVGGRDALAALLEERGARVDNVAVYRRGLPRTSTDAVQSELKSDGIGFITITSQLALDNLFALLGPAGAAAIQQTPLVVISERIADYARQCGCRQVLLATQASDEGLVETLVSTTHHDMGTAL